MEDEVDVLTWCSGISLVCEEPPWWPCLTGRPQDFLNAAGWARNVHPRLEGIASASSPSA